MDFHSPTQVSFDSKLEGDISSHGAATISEESLKLLNEPIRDTIARSLKAVGKKFSHVLFPRKSQELLDDWDLWGPLLLCLVMSVFLHGDGITNSGGPEFAQVFVIFWLGAVVVTLNAKLLGGTLSFLQSVCILGYCILPLVISLIVCRILLLVGSTSLWLFILRLGIVALGLIYSSFASFVFLTPAQPPNRVGLALYPVCLFNFFLAWLVISMPV